MSEWRLIPSCPPYEASSDGEIRRLGASSPLRPHTHKDGYARVSLWSAGIGGTRGVRRLVCEAFHGPAPAGADAAHANGDRTDNRAVNLRWASRAENERDKVAHGLTNIGERNGGASLTEATVREIRRRYAAAPRSSGGARVKKGTLIALAGEFGVTVTCISSIAAGRLWRHVV